MDHNTFRIFTYKHVETALRNRENAIIQAVQQAYEGHADGESSLPHSSFLLFPQQPQNRIIGLPAYLGGTTNLAGIKWIASFPDNYSLGLERASAVIIINSVETGQPLALLEGSLISKKRTAASAALAASYLHSEQTVKRVGLIGTGVINFEILRFLRVVYPSICQVVLYDLSSQRAEEFRQHSQSEYPEIEVLIAASSDEVFQQVTLVSCATTAAQPYIHHLPEDSITETILHISLRDLAPKIILEATNVVDDIDHVMRAKTSLQLAEQEVGHRDFIHYTLADITRKLVSETRRARRVTIFSPFGLGVLDLAVSKIVMEQAFHDELGIILPSFLPEL